MSSSWTLEVAGSREHTHIKRKTHWLVSNAIGVFLWISQLKHPLIQQDCSGKGLLMGCSQTGWVQESRLSWIAGWQIKYYGLSKSSFFMRQSVFPLFARKEKKTDSLNASMRIISEFTEVQWILSCQRTWVWSDPYCPSLPIFPNSHLFFMNIFLFCDFFFSFCNLI